MSCSNFRSSVAFFTALAVPHFRVLKDHTDSSGVHSQALDSVRAKLVETEAALKREKEAFRKAQVRVATYTYSKEKLYICFVCNRSGADCEM